MFAIWIVAIVLAPLVAQVLAMMVSRGREYLADATGAELTRNPLGLASALEKIERASEPTKAIGRGSAHLCIADPLERRIATTEGFWADLSRRIRRWPAASRRSIRWRSAAQGRARSALRS